MQRLLWHHPCKIIQFNCILPCAPVILPPTYLLLIPPFFCPHLEQYAVEVVAYDHVGNKVICGERVGKRSFEPANDQSPILIDGTPPLVDVCPPKLNHMSCHHPKSSNLALRYPWLPSACASLHPCWLIVLFTGAGSMLLPPIGKC